MTINAEGIVELEKSLFCNNHSNSDFRHISEWMLKPKRDSLLRDRIFTQSQVSSRRLLITYKREKLPLQQRNMVGPL